MEIAIQSPLSAENSFRQQAHKIGPEINKYIDEEKINRRLSRPVIEALKEAGYFRMYLPKSLGGHELDPVTTAKTIEEIAMYNTAAGWALMVANSSTWMCGRLPEKGVDEIFESDPDTYIAGAFHPFKQATKVEGGFLINGRGPLYSNVHESKWILFTAMVMENGAVKMHEGRPEAVCAILKREECEIIDTWQTLGMQATDSNDVSAKDVFVPDHRIFYMMPHFEPNRHFTSPLYKYPSVGINVASLLPPISLANARKAINELKIMAAVKTPLGSFTPIRDKGTLQSKLGKAEALVESGRAYLYQTLADSWNKTLAGEILSLEARANILLAATHANHNCWQAVDLVYSAAGSTSIYSKNKIANYFTDAQVLRQHGFMNESRYETAAQILLGLEADLPIIAF